VMFVIDSQSHDNGNDALLFNEKNSYKIEEDRSLLKLTKVDSPTPHLFFIF
jgi:hypothetical protein